MLNNSLNKFLEMDPIEFDQGKGGWRSRHCKLNS